MIFGACNVRSLYWAGPLKTVTTKLGNYKDNGGSEAADDLFYTFSMEMKMLMFS